MSKLAQLRARRDAKAKDAQTLNGKYNADQRMTADDANTLDTVLNEIEAIDAEITRDNRVNQVAGDEHAEHEAAMNAATVNGGRSNEAQALRAMLAGGLSALTPEQRQAMVARQSPEIRQAMSTTTGTEGGYTVATEYNRQLIEAMKEIGGVRPVAHVFQTATGASMNFPTADATAEEGEIVGQNTAVGAGDTAFGNVTMEVFKYSSKKIALPFELLQDSMFNLEAYVQKLLALRIGRITNRHYTVGTGVNQPRGLITAAVVGKTAATGGTATITYDDLVELEHSVDPAYRALARYMFHDDSLKVLRKIKDGNSRPIFVPGYETGNPGGAPDRIMGRTFSINQHMAPMAANAKSIAFGDLSKYFVRDVMDLTVFRMTDSAFTLLGQVGFVAFMRSGGNLIDVGGAVKLYQNSAT